MANNSWASDVPVSMPAPLAPDNPMLVDMDGFAFTANGLFHNLDETQHEALGTPTYAPHDPSDIVWDDDVMDTDTIEELM